MSKNQVHSYGNLAETGLAEQPSSTKRLSLGHYIDDGAQKYRYAKISDASGVSPGKLYVQHRTSGYHLADSAYIQCVNNGAYGGQLGDTVVKVYSAVGLSADAFVDGFLTTSTGVGAGYGANRINHYETGVAGKATKIFLDKPLRQKLSTTSRLVVHKSPYMDLVEASGVTGTASRSAIPRGWGVVSGDAGASGYSFIQTKGIGNIYCQQAVLMGEHLTPTSGGGVYGLSNAAVSGGEADIVAKALCAAGDGDFVAADLLLE